METESLQIALRLAGLILVGLVVANWVAARRFRYAAALAGCDTIVRQIFYVHCAYIVAIIAALAVLCLAWPEMLMDGGTGRVVCAFFALFWGSRVVVQLSYYDRGLRRSERAWDLFFLAVFLLLTTIFTLCVFPS